MLERFAAQVLNHYIGHYVENFNPENLSIGIVQGAVELEDLSLRKDALNGLDLPGVEVKWGYIGKISLKIPSYKNYSEPWVIDINNLYLIVGPQSGENKTFNEETEQLKREQLKQKRLAAVEERWNATHGSNKSLYSIWQAYSSSIVTNIVQNLEVRLFDLHIRYEDDVTMENPFAFGIKIDVLSAQTTDENWVPKTSSSKYESMKWKKMQLDKMSVYWNTQAHLYSTMEASKIKDAMKNVEADDITNSLHQILKPVSGEAHFAQDCSPFPLRKKSQPRLSLSLSLSSIPITLEKLQYRQIISLAAEFDRWDKQKQNRADKPLSSVMESPRLWWQWVVNTQLKKNRIKKERRSFQFIVNRVQQIVSYVRSYKQLLYSKYLTKVQSEDAAKNCREIEFLLSFDEVSILRDIVYNQIDEEMKAKENEKKGKSKQTGAKRVKSFKNSTWTFGSWFRWGGGKPDQVEPAETSTEAEEDFPQEVKQASDVDQFLEESVYKDLDDDEILEMFGDDLENQDTNDTFLKRDSVLLKLDFKMESGSFKLVEALDRNDHEKMSEMAILEFKSVKLSSEWRPRYSAREIKINLGELIVTDLARKDESFHEILKTTPPLKRSSSPAVLTPPLLPSKVKDLASNVYHHFFTQKPPAVEEGNTDEKSEKPPVFSVTYEKLPSSNSQNFSDSLEIVTAPLSFTIVPGLLDRIKEFFKQEQTDGPSASYKLEHETFTTTAHERYSRWMQQAQSEIRRSVKRVMEGKTQKESSKMKQNRWAVSLDIFAPELIIPSNCSDPNCTALILNLGHMTFENHHAEKTKKKEKEDVEESSSDQEDSSSDDDDEDFITPPDTPTSEENLTARPSVDLKVPPVEASQDVEEVQHPQVEDARDRINMEQLSEEMLKEKMYDRYHLNMSNLQVAIIPDITRIDAIRSGGKSSYHLVERFSVELLVERRVVPTYDPLFPALLLTANLPHLTIHISHTKVRDMGRCIDQFKRETKKSAPHQSWSSKLESERKKANLFTSASRQSITDDQEKAKSKQLACDFRINQISVVLEQGQESGNQILCVLEICQVQSIFTLRPHDTSTSLSIHSLLLVDVMQQLGKDYELLLASHKTVCMDVESGNILDSGATSPYSVSQSYPLGSLAQKEVTTEQSSMMKRRHLSASVPTSHTTSVLTNVAHNLSEFASSYAPFGTEEIVVVQDADKNDSAFADQEHLIKLEVRNFEKGSPEFSDGDEGFNANNRVKAYFSNLDLVFNPRSWITLLNYLHKLKPTDKNNKTKERDVNNSNNLEVKPALGKTDIASVNSGDEQSTRITIDFKKLNFLLFRHVSFEENVVGHKIATLTIHGAQVVAEIGSDWKKNASADFQVDLDVRGSLSGLQMQDLCTSKNNTEVLSLGLTPSDGHEATKQLNLDRSENLEAFSFKLLHGGLKNFSQSVKKTLSDKFLPKERLIGSQRILAASTNDISELIFNMDDEDMIQTGFTNKVELTVDIASACYIHSPRLMAEVLALIDETGDFSRDQMTPATREAYKDMARSIVDKVSDYSMAVLGRSVHDKTLFPDEASPSSPDPSTTNSTHFNLLVSMESPLVAIPKYPGSYELLIAHLGKITVKNEHQFASGFEPFDILNIEVTDMKVSSHRQKSEELEAKKSQNLLSSGPSISKLKHESHKSFGENACHILHDTSIQLSVRKIPFVPGSINPLDKRNCCNGLERDEKEKPFCCDRFASCVGPLSDKRMSVTLRASSEITVTLSKLAYEQLLKTLDNIAYGGNIDDIDELADVTHHSAHMTSSSSGQPAHSVSAPNLLDPQQSQEILNFQRDRRATLSVTSQSTPQKPNELILFQTPELLFPAEMFPAASEKSSQTTLLGPVPRKYTPVSANLMLPRLIFQLSGDLSDGEQGLVKVTLEEFTGLFEKENKFGSAFALSLGSLEIEDLLQPENSPHRHIVMSHSGESDNSKRKNNDKKKTSYISTSCPSLSPMDSDLFVRMSSSFPSSEREDLASRHQSKAQGVFRPYEVLGLTSGAFGSTVKKSRRKSNRTSSSDYHPDPEDPPTPPCSPRIPEKSSSPHKSSASSKKLVNIRVFLVDGKSEAYTEIYDRVNRRIDVDFNALDCKINLQTWVVLLDFFGIGTSPKKTYHLDRETEETFSWDKRLDIRSFYENQPTAHVNSEIEFVVKSFSLVFNKVEYQLLKADVTALTSHIRIRDATLGVKGQLGGLSVSDVSPNGALYAQRFTFTGDKALDFDIFKYDEYDHELSRDFDIRVRLRMSSVRYVHTQRFQNETVAFCQHFQQLQEVLGRMRAASVGQSIRSSSCRQARVELDVETGAAIILIPESSHADRLLVVNLGNINVRNKFIRDGDPGTTSYESESRRDMSTSARDVHGRLDDSLVDNDEDMLSLKQLTSPSSVKHRCLLDVIHVDLTDMDIFAASISKNSPKKSSTQSSDSRLHLVFSSYSVTCIGKSLLKEKAQLSLQLKRNLEKEVTHQGVPDTSLSVHLSSVYCSLDHSQYWLVRGVLDHNAGEAIPDFPQPTAFLQPSKLQTVLTGDIYVGLRMDIHLINVSIELLQSHDTGKSLGRMDFVRSLLSYEANSNNVKTTNLTCQEFRAIDTRGQARAGSEARHRRNVFSRVLGPLKKPSPDVDSETLVQFEIFQRSGPGFMELTALLSNMRLYVILDWLQDTQKYLIVNPDQCRCDSLREKTAQLMDRHGQIDTGNQRKLDNQGQLEPEVRSTEVKLNVTETEFVMPQDITRFDTDAVILRSTAVLQYRPVDGDPEQYLSARHHRSPPLRCGLQRLEVFSCQLDEESETALSIVDPVTINLEVRPLKQVDVSQEEINSNLSILDCNLLDVQVSELNVRVSYNDVILFLAILKSLPINSSQADPPQPDDRSASHSRLKPVFKPNLQFVDSLTDIGYSYKDVIYALSINNGDVTKAGSWLLSNAKLDSNTKQVEISKKTPLGVARLNLQIDVARICLIDDCGVDCDVPLAEFAVHGLTVRQGIASDYVTSMDEVIRGQNGFARFILTGDYFNRLLSLWEPFLEPWRCNLGWQHDKLLSSNYKKGSWKLKVDASDRFDVSVTSALIDTAKKTSSAWRSGYEKATRDAAGGTRTPPAKRVRQPFVPYILRNLTGCPLYFATQTTARHADDITASVRSLSSAHDGDQLWVEVLPGEDHPFHFATSHEKQRHKRTGLLKLHQIRVKVGGWKTLKPVTVSRVGVYFRHAFPQINTASNVYDVREPVRVVFSVTLEGSAQKIVTIRSALAVKSRLKIPIQIQLEKITQNDKEKLTLPLLDPGQTLYVPINMTSYDVRIRPGLPKQTLHHYSTQALDWQSCAGDVTERSDLVECVAMSTGSRPFYFAVSIQKRGFPSYEEVYESLTEEELITEDDGSGFSTEFYPSLPGHTIIILPPVVISNLLPCDLTYYVKNLDINGNLKPGMDATPHLVHLHPNRAPNSLIIGCLLENFKSCRELIVPPNNKNFQMRMLIKDENDRTLVLNVRILWRLHCSVKISIMAGYWIVNTTGLPIIVRQDRSQLIAAGQYDTHEQARSLQPLLFSYSNRDDPYLCSMRLGKRAQLDDFMRRDHLRMIPVYCESFSTDGGSCTRNLKLVTNDGTPNREFYIGISVRRGWGRYLHTHIVTVAPRFLLINKTKSRRLSVAQRHTISYTSDSSGNNCHLAIVPGSSVVFHWPRVDLDTLLCVRLSDEPACLWSGGFFIDRTDAFHISLRLAAAANQLSKERLHHLAPHCIFLSVEVTLVNATYCVSLSDADPDLVPPPLRIDNVSSAPIVFKQVGTDESYNTEVPPESQLAYACDEPSYPYNLQCTVKGSSQVATLDMGSIGIEKQLYYENFIYITVGLSPLMSSHSASQQSAGSILVLDVSTSHKTSFTSNCITLQPMRSGKRSQLWSMTSDGRIFHVGSSPPDQDSKSKSRNSGLVLDIGEMAVGRSLDGGIPLALRPSDERRKSTQTWGFSNDGRLQCKHRNLCVKVQSLSVGGAAVLASFDPKSPPHPPELCSRRKMILGSGVLSLKVVRDGPTRVLRVVDIRQKRAGIFAPNVDWTLLDRRHPSDDVSNGEMTFVSDAKQSDLKFYASVNMPKGVGVSLVSNTPEELLYLTMNGVQMDVSMLPDEQTFTLRLQKLQIDNQLLDGYPPVMLCPRTSTSSSSSRDSSTDPLISVQIIRQPSQSRLYQIIKSMVVDVGHLSIQIDETLLYKLLHFVGYGSSATSRDSEVLDEAKMDINRVACSIGEDDVSRKTRFYFDTLRLSFAPMRLSVITTSRLAPELKSVKQALRFSLIQFERAPVAIQAYKKRHLFETSSFVVADFSKHLRDQLKGQAAKILGSVDFLGNPIGLLTDVKAGMTGLAKGNIPNMVKHFTHGISDSTAKVVSTISDGIGEITLDEEYEDKRRAIHSNAKNAGGHVVAGLQGLMTGVIGGLTSVITQPVRGAQNDGARGFFTGIGKGIIGTVTKPVTGVLDLASESASAVRQMSLSSSDVYRRARPIRCCHTFQGCLQCYSHTQASGQQFLYQLNRNDFSEHFYAMNKLSFQGNDNMLVIITGSKVYFVKDKDADPENIFLEVEYSNLVRVRVLDLRDDDLTMASSNSSSRTLLELTVKPVTNARGKASMSSTSPRPSVKHPRVLCHSRVVAENVCQKITYAKTIASEQTETLLCDAEEEEAEELSFDLEV